MTSNGSRSETVGGNGVNHLNAEFWLDVQRELEIVHGQPPDQARQGVDKYRQRLARHEAADAVYHWEPGDIARAISGGRFLLDPPPK